MRAGIRTWAGAAELALALPSAADAQPERYQSAGLHSTWCHGQVPPSGAPERGDNWRG